MAIICSRNPCFFKKYCHLPCLSLTQFVASQLTAIQFLSLARFSTKSPKGSVSAALSFCPRGTMLLFTGTSVQPWPSPLLGHRMDCLPSIPSQTLLFHSSLSRLLGALCMATELWPISNNKPNMFNHKFSTFLPKPSLLDSLFSIPVYDTLIFYLFKPKH